MSVWLSQTDADALLAMEKHRVDEQRWQLPDAEACAGVVADVMNWFDEYMHAALGLGIPRKTRFRKADLMSLNAYSIG
jgi:hypothetical protein